eukprot:g24928.t1
MRRTRMDHQGGHGGEALADAAEQRKASQWQLALGVSWHLGVAKLSAYTYGLLLRALTKGVQWTIALEVLDTMPHAQVQPNLIIFNSAIACCSAGAAWPHALRLLQVMQTEMLQADVISCSSAISACEKGLQWRKALEA